MSERPKLSLPGKGKADFPPKPPVQEDAPFDVTDSRRKANETIDSLKNSLYAAGLSPAQVSKQWAAARVNHDSLLRTLEEYKEAGTSERKKELERAFAEKLAALKGDQSDDLQEAVQESYLAKPKKRTSRRKQGMSDGKAEKLIEQGIAASNNAELESSEARRKEIRDRLGVLESVASTREVEKEALRLEAELRAREKTDPIDSLEGADSEELPEEAQGESAAEPAPVPAADETPKETHDRLESLISGYAGEPHHSVPAVMDGLEPRRTGAAETPDVIALKDHSGRKKRPAETLEAMAALTEAQKREQSVEEEYLREIKE